jgi:hypothetical protein
LPDNDNDDGTEYHVPLEELTGKHGYALARGEDDDEPMDPGAPVAYVADVMKERPSALTIEGMIAGVGQAAQAASHEGGAPQWAMRVLAALFIIPVILTLGRQVGLF